MSSLLVVVKSHLFPQFVQLNREIGTSRGHWGDGEFTAVNRGWHCTRELHGAAAVESMAMDGAGNPSEARWRRQLLTTLAHNRYLVEAPG